MIRILKYQPSFKIGFGTINTFMGCKPLTVQLQVNTPSIWCECDETSAPGILPFIVVGTGQVPFSPEEFGVQYLATIQREGFVWHYYVGKPEPLSAVQLREVQS